jgi:hypothetical protein
MQPMMETALMWITQGFFFGIGITASSDGIAWLKRRARKFHDR